MNPTRPTAVEWPVRHIVCPLAARDVTGAIRELATTLEGAPGVIDTAQLMREVHARESQAPTYLGGGVAMPHARSTAVDRLAVAVGLSREGMRWGSSRELARLVFLVGVPREDDGAYLEMVRKITQTIRHLEWLEQAMACPDAPALARLLEQTIHF